MSGLRQSSTASATPPSARPRRRLVTRLRLAVLLGGLGGGFIVLNAVAFQTEKHPAPMFQPVARAKEPPQPAQKNALFDPKPVAGAKPVADRPAPLERAVLAEKLSREDKPGLDKPVLDKPAADRSAATKSAAEKPQPAAPRAAMKDELLDLVRRADQDEKPQKTVLDVQRALNKAGYGPLSEDGQMGPSTRAALARFEQDKKLPQKGELNRPVLRALASASGIAIAQ